jgi:hypothetical protein
MLPAIVVEADRTYIETPIHHFLHFLPPKNPHPFSTAIKPTKPSLFFTPRISTRNYSYPLAREESRESFAGCNTLWSAPKRNGPGGI